MSFTLIQSDCGLLLTETTPSFLWKLLTKPTVSLFSFFTFYACMPLMQNIHSKPWWFSRLWQMQKKLPLAMYKPWRLRNKTAQKKPYKPWRCTNCTDKYCKHCDKTFPPTDQDSICCDKCSYWFHLRCTDLTKTDFDKLCEDESAKWFCQKCVNNYCKKCDTSVYHKAKISCCLCSHTYHFSCVNLPKTYKDDKTFTKNWICFTSSTLTPKNLLTTWVVTNLKNNHEITFKHKWPIKNL